MSKRFLLAKTKSEFVINTCIRDANDHYCCTLYKKEREKLNIQLGDIIIVQIGKYELFRKVLRDYMITLPKKIFKNNKHAEIISLQIIKIIKQEESHQIPEKVSNDDQLYLTPFIPKKTREGKKIIICSRENNMVSVWYLGCVKHINLKTTIPLEQIGELVGFYYGDGSTSANIKSFRLTNSEPSILIHCINILNQLGINKRLISVQIIYCTNKTLTTTIIRRCRNFWRKKLRIHNKQIISVLASKNIRETIPYGSARVIIDSNVLTEIMLSGLLPSIMRKISCPKNYQDMLLAKGFLRGVMAAEGFVSCNKTGSVVRTGIAFDPHSEEKQFYQTLLLNCGITNVKVHHNAIQISRYKNFKILHEMQAFSLHERRHKLFLKGIMVHRFHVFSNKPQR